MYILNRIHVKLYSTCLMASGSLVLRNRLKDTY